MPSANPSTLRVLLLDTIVNITSGIVGVRNFNMTVPVYLSTTTSNALGTSFHYKNISISYVVSFEYPSLAGSRLYFNFVSATLQGSVASGRFNSVFHALCVHFHSSLVSASSSSRIQIVGSNGLQSSSAPAGSPSVTSSQSSSASTMSQSTSIVITIAVLAAVVFFAAVTVLCMWSRKRPGLTAAELGDLADLYSEKLRQQNQSFDSLNVYNVGAGSLVVCKVCKKVVYQTDSQLKLCDKYVVHQNCAVCARCNIPLVASSTCGFDGNSAFFCAEHSPVPDDVVAQRSSASESVLDLKSEADVLKL